MKFTRAIVIVLVAVALILLGRSSTRWGAEPADSEFPASEARSAEAAPEAILWTCPMHAQIKLPDAGDCPLCGMDLVPLQSQTGEHPRRLVMSPASKELARVQSTPVERRNVTRPVRLVGKIDFDETRVRTISAWVSGRLDRLFVDYTGVPVAIGDHLVRLYSPDLFTAQEELLSALARSRASDPESSEFLAESDRRTYMAAREKLSLWGLTDSQIDEVVERGSAEAHVMLTSPSTGVVIEKLLDEGAYVQTGNPIYRVADLSQLWVRLDAYEQDLAWLRHGQPVEIEVEALPGESFEGRISFIDPIVHERTRTAKVRVNIDNDAGRLKPGMFVRALAMSRLGAGGAVIDQHLAGKWVSPMHPEIVKDEAGECDICGMPLVRAELLGLVSDVPVSDVGPLVVPASSVLITGKRAVVYVEVPEEDRPTFEGREVKLGPRAGDDYIVLSGLAVGERVVTNGAFRIDSSMQILAKPSMMGMGAEARGEGGPELALFRESSTEWLEAYLRMQRALAADDEPKAREALLELDSGLAGLDGTILPKGQRSTWADQVAVLQKGVSEGKSSNTIEGLRHAFEHLSQGALHVVKELGHALATPLVEAHCPMAFDFEGASWLQVGEVVQNPYFGDEMLTCGSVRQRFEAGN